MIDLKELKQRLAELEEMKFGLGLDDFGSAHQLELIGWCRDLVAEVERLTKLDELHQKTATPAEYVVQLNDLYKDQIERLQHEKAKLEEVLIELDRLDAESVKAWNECVLLRAELKEAKKWCFDDNTVRELKAELKAAKEKLELVNAAADFLDTLYKQAPTLREECLDNFDGYFCCLSEIQKACQSAWSSPRGFR